MSNRSRRERERELRDRLAELEDRGRPELSVTITRHDYEAGTLDADESEYDFETVSESDWFAIRDAVTIDESDESGDIDDGDTDE